MKSKIIEDADVVTYVVVCDQGEQAVATLRELVAGLGAAMDAAGGGFTMGYTTVTVTAARTVTTPTGQDQ